MRIEVRDERRRHLGWVEIDPAQRPTRASVARTGHEVFFNWEASQDDSGRLRRCVVCGCGDLFRERAFPQVTGLIVVLAFAGALVGTLDMATPPVLAAMLVVLVLDVGILLFSRLRLVCYRCRSSYHQLPIAGYHRPWDRATAERYAPSPESIPEKTQEGVSDEESGVRVRGLV